MKWDPRTKLFAYRLCLWPVFGLSIAWHFLWSAWIDGRCFVMEVIAQWQDLDEE